MGKAILMVGLLYILFIIGNTLWDYWKTFHKRKCPMCGEKMHYVKTVQNDSGNPLYCVFKCEKCQHEVSIWWHKIMDF